MILPHSHLSVMILLILSALCWGSWPSAFRFSSKWRYELFLFDVAIGFMACAIVGALTVGSLGYDGFSAIDDALNAGKREWVTALAAGAVFNLATMLLMSAISLAGMAVAFPAWAGVGLAAGIIFRLFAKSGANVPLLIGGIVLSIATVITASMAYKDLARQRHERAAKAGAVKSTKRPQSLKAIILACIGGLALTLSLPILDAAMVPDVGLGPYSALLFVGLGVLFSTVAYNLFFMNLPVQGQPVDIFDYMKGDLWSHIAGLAGGAVLCISVLAGLVATAANSQTGVGAALPPGEAPVNAWMVYAIPRLAPVVAAVWGVLKWHEIKDGDGKVSLLTWTAVAIFIGSLAAVSAAIILTVQKAA